MIQEHASDRVIIFDTTLRDGEQSPGASMNLTEKLALAHQLAALGVDVIEAGFPIASPGDFEAVQAIAREVKGPIIAGLARSNAEDIDRAWEALQEAERARIHVFLATSAIHRQYKLRMAKEEIIRKTRESVAHARSLCSDVEFSAEDAARTEPEFLSQVVEAAIGAGAKTVNIPDTVGYAMPEQYAELITYLKQNVPNIDQAVVSVHCHNDLGMAVANSLAAVRAGARQIECTINGIGERAGNCSLEEVVMALKTRRDYFGLETGVKTPKLYPTSQMLSQTTGMQVQRNKAIVGRNAFAHEAGIHQHGVMMHTETYEIMKPEDVGIQSNQLVLGKHSGRHAFRQWAGAHGYNLSEERLEQAFRAFKALADKKKEVFEADLEALVEGTAHRKDHPWSIESIQTSAGTLGVATAAVTLRNADSGDVIEEAACGTGPVEALFKAIERAADVRLRLKRYELHSVTKGKDALGDVSVEVLIEGHTFTSHAVSTDIIEGSGHALMNALNRYLNRQSKEQPKAAAAVH